MGALGSLLVSKAWLLLLAVSGSLALSTTFPPLQQKSQRLFHTYANPVLLEVPVKLRYVEAERNPQSTKKSPVLCIHGFGGNADQFRKQLPALSNEGHDTFALDLLGYGYSDKPDPRKLPVNALYNFEEWGRQVADFVKNEIKEPTFLVCNSVGGCVGLQAAVTNPELVKGVVLIDVSLRMLNVKKQPPLIKPVVRLIQDTLRDTPAGEFFFKQVAERKALGNVLKQAYAGDVDDETVSLILEPGLLPGADRVFLDFISYSGGPLPEELLEQCTRPVRMLWGERDPWEPLAQGRELAKNAPIVDEFVVLEAAGHCPMDQTPDAVNRELVRFFRDRG